jgi:hypothetical protein
MAAVAECIPQIGQWQQNSRLLELNRKNHAAKHGKGRLTGLAACEGIGALLISQLFWGGV